MYEGWVGNVQKTAVTKEVVIWNDEAVLGNLKRRLATVAASEYLRLVHTANKDDQDFEFSKKFPVKRGPS